MTTLNSAQFIEDAVNSIFAQTYTQWEFIVVDGGSSDGTVERINAISDSRIRLYKCHELRRSAQLNYALKQATGEYIAIMDSDDIALPQRLEEQVQYLQSNTSVALAGSWSEYIDVNGKFLEVNKRPLEHEAIIQHLFSFGQPSLSSLMFKKSVLESGYYFNESLQGLEDIEWYMHIASVARFAVIPKVLMKFRQRENSLSKQNNDANKKIFIDCVDAYFSHRREGDHPMLPLSLWGIAHYYFGESGRARKLLFQSLKVEGCHSQTFRYLLPATILPGTLRNYFRRSRVFKYIAHRYRTAGHSNV